MSDEVTEFTEKLNPLPEETRWEAQKKRRERQSFAKECSAFVIALQAAMVEYFSFRKQGVSREDAIKGLEVVIRDVWPKQVSKFTADCDACDDTGFQEDICRPYVRCGRKECDRHGEDFQHRYVRFCFCAKGEGFRRKAHKTPEPETAVAQIGKTAKSKKGSWNRLGV